MSNNDLYPNQGHPESEFSPQPPSSDGFDPKAFADMFHPDEDLGYEFDNDESCIYTAPAEGIQLPNFDEQPDFEEPSIPHPPTEQEPLSEDSLPPLEPLFFSDFQPEPNPQVHAYRAPEYHEDQPDDFVDDYEESFEDDYEDDEEPRHQEQAHHGPRVIHTVLNVLLGFLTFFSFLYLVAVYSNNSVVVGLRNMYIQTAMSSLNHKYLATAIFPSEMIDDLMRMQYESENAMLGVETQWGDLDIKALPTFENATGEMVGAESEQEEAQEELLHENDGVSRSYESEEEKTFFELFYEIDYDSMHAYLDDHPQVLDEGWSNIEINRSALGDEGTAIQTIYGDQVLALNAQRGIVLVRVNIDYSRGVFAICKDTSDLHLRAASTIGTIGQTAGRICDANDGILAVTGSAFVDPNGEGNGGEISGLAICNGVTYGSPIWSNYKRVEFRNDNKMYIMDSGSEIDSDVRDAVEFTPALIIDGEVVVDENCGWTSPNPRTAIGQTAYLETVLAVVEGRFTDSPGCSVVTLANKLAQYGCVQAMNMDGGTSAIMYYDGCYVTRCSNASLPSGRPMPTAWVYG